MPSVWRRSGLVEFDNNGDKATGALARFYAGGTSTPITVYSDAAESTPRFQPVEADANGRWPLVFIPFMDDYDEKVTDAGGTQLSYYQRIPNADPVEASTDTVDAAELVSTGRILFDPIGGTASGYVRANGRTIGNAASGATERANADTEDLFVRYWNGMANGQAAVSGGRGASAAADYAANKTLTLPDLRGAIPIGVDDMGNSAASLFGGATFAHGNATTAGSIAGANTHTLVTSETPAHTHGVGTYVNAANGGHSHGLSAASAASGGAHTHSVTDPQHSHVETGGSNAVSVTNGSGPQSVAVVSTSTTNVASTGISIDSGGAHTHGLSGTTDSVANHTHVISGSSASVGGDGAHNNLSRVLLGTWLIKL